MMSSSSDDRMSCTCFNGHKTYGWKRSGFLIVILVVLISASVILPYILVVARRLLPAFIPFISQAGGAPPQSGIFAIPLITSGFTGLILFPALFVSINQRNRLNSVWLRRFNTVSFPVAVISFLGCIITAAFPIDYTEVPNQLEWIVTVLMEHGTGATMILVGIVIYQFILTGVWWFLPDVSKTSKFVKTGFCIAYLIIFAIVIEPGFTFISEELGNNSNDLSALRNVTTFQLPKVFSPSYQILAFFEWAVCFMSLINLIVIYKDIQRISVHFTVRPKSCFMDVSEPTELSLTTLS